MESRTTDHVDILGVPISRFGMKEAIRRCEDRLASRQGGFVCFVNVHTSVENTRNPSLNAAFQSSYLNFADGIPLVWTSRARNRPIASRVCGPDFMNEWLRLHPESSGFIGGEPGRAEEIGRRFEIKNSVCYSPPMRPFSKENAKEDWREFLRRCPDESPPAIVWVGLGAPKQELWMATVSEIAPSTLFFGVGAAFDFLSGAKKRAPLWMQNSGLEWLFRFSQEPERLLMRYLTTNSMFVWYLAKSLLTKEDRECL